MKKILSVLVLISLFGSASALAAKEDAPTAIAGVATVTAEGLIDLVDSHEDLVIIDSRKPSDRDKGFIEGSHGLPDTETSAQSLAQFIATKSTPVVFYCNGVKCLRSATAAEIAVEHGYNNVYWFRTGWAEWTEQGYPVAH